MQMFANLTLSGTLLAAVLAAAPPVATVDSDKPFAVNGRVMPVSGVGGWPVFRGDKISTVDGRALLKFSDGSYVRLGKRSQISLLQKSGKVGLKLVEGDASFRLASQKLLVLEDVSTAAAESGMLSIEEGQVKLTAIGSALLLTPRASKSADAPIGIVYGSIPPRTELVPGPDPISSYRGEQ